MTPCNSCERLVEALERIASGNNELSFCSYDDEPASRLTAAKALSEYTTSQQPSPQPVPPSVATAEEFDHLISPYKKSANSAIGRPTYKFLYEQLKERCSEYRRQLTELEKQLPSVVTVEGLEQIVNDKIDQETAFTPIGQRHATMCIIAREFPNGIKLSEDK